MDKFDAIKYFCTAAETLNFRETANRLAISPSVITRVINELEGQLGEPLFKRNTRSIRLTSFGEQFLPKARQWLNDSDSLFQTAKVDEKMAGVVRITAPAWRENDMIISELLNALADYPDLVIDWRDDMAKLDGIAHRIDIGIRIGPQPDPNFIVRPISEIGDLIVAAPALLERLGQPQDLDDLCRRYPFVGQINDATGRAWDLILNDKITLLPQRTVFLSNDIYSGFQAIVQGKAVGLMSDFFCRPYVQSGELCVLFPEVLIQKWQLFLYRPYQTVTTARVLKVFDLLTEILRKRYGGMI